MPKKGSSGLRRDANRKEQGGKPDKAPEISQEQLTGLLDIAEDAVISVNSAQVITFFNRGAAKIFGFTPAETVGKPLDVLLPARFVEAHRRHVVAFGESPERSRTMGQRGRIWGRRKDGSEFPAEASIARWGADADPVFTVFLRDISERWQAQREIERLNTLLAAQLETSLDAMLVVDQTGVMASFNRRFVDLWDLPPEVVASRSDQRALDAVTGNLADPEEFRARVAYLYEHHGETSRDEVLLKDGRTLDRYSTPMYDRSGGYLGRVWYFRDITDRKRMNEALRRTVAELNEAQRVARVGSWRLDLATNQVVWTEELYRMLGLDPQQPPPPYTEHQRLFTPESWSQLSAALPHTQETGIPYELELEMTRADGSRGWMLARGEVMRDGNDRVIGVRGTAQDITERKRADDALRRANRALRVLSATNQALIRAGDELDLLDCVCRVIVELGGYRMAWIGFVEHDDGKSIRPVAQTGYETGYLDRIGITWADTERGRGPTGTAVRTGSTQISRNIATDPKMMPWREDALARGYASSIALPLIGETGPFGALTIYSKDANAFNEDETALLRELSEDLAFGIMTHRADLERRLAEARAEHLANFDTLTGLPNRVQLISHLTAATGEARIDGHPLAVLAFSVDRFIEIQDGIGIAGADDLLQKIASRLGAAAGEGNFLARILGEWFAIVIPQADAGRARESARRLQAAMNDPFEYAGVLLDVQATIGVALFPAHGADADALVRRSDIAVRQARGAGIDYALYSGVSDTESPGRLTLLTELRRAMRSDALRLHYQPKIDTRSGRITGVEALLRWQHPERGSVPPNQFIPLAEHTGLIKPLTYWVLGAALKQITDWQQQGIEIPVAVNVSPNNLRDPEFLGHIETLQAESGARLDLLEFEITETALMTDPARSHDVLNRIGELGIHVFIDDFGTGYSSLSYIATLPVQAIKIDRSFVLKMMELEQHRAVVAAAISMAHSLGLTVVAEGIETAEQAEALVRLGCDEIQGYFFSRPLPAAELLRWHSGFKWKL